MEQGRNKFMLSSRIASLKPAFRGVLFVLRNGHNARIHQVAALTVIILGVVFYIIKHDWLVIILCIGLVISLEIMNSAIEKLVDLFSPERNDKAKLIKDVAAGAVLISAVISLVTGLLIFLPYLIAAGKQIL
jgi:diacylglycerol kinase